MISGSGANPIFINKKNNNKDWKSRTLATLYVQ